MSKEELLTKALELLEKRKYSELRSELIDMEPIDIAPFATICRRRSCRWFTVCCPRSWRRRPL